MSEPGAPRMAECRFSHSRLQSLQAGRVITASFGTFNALGLTDCPSLAPAGPATLAAFLHRCPPGHMAVQQSQYWVFSRDRHEQGRRDVTYRRPVRVPAALRYRPDRPSFGPAVPSRSVRGEVVPTRWPRACPAVPPVRWARMARRCPDRTRAEARLPGYASATARQRVPSTFTGPIPDTRVPASSLIPVQLSRPYAAAKY
jgi:hypothetical protein